MTDKGIQELDDDEADVSGGLSGISSEYFAKLKGSNIKITVKYGVSPKPAADLASLIQASKLGDSSSI